MDILTRLGFYDKLTMEFPMSKKTFLEKLKKALIEKQKDRTFLKESVHYECEIKGDTFEIARIMDSGYNNDYTLGLGKCAETKGKLIVHTEFIAFNEKYLRVMKRILFFVAIISFIVVLAHLNCWFGLGEGDLWILLFLIGLLGLVELFFRILFVKRMKKDIKEQYDGILEK